MSEPTNLRRSSRRTKRVVFTALAAGVALAATAAPAAQAAEPDPLTILSRSGSVYATAGMNGTLSTTYQNNTAQDLNDIYITYDASITDSGLTLPGPSAGKFYSPDCAQPGGPGATVTCGPFSLAAGSVAGHTWAYDLPSDFLLRHGPDAGAAPAFGTTATVTTASGLTSKPVYRAQGVISDVTMQTTLHVVPPGTVLEEAVAPASSQFDVASGQNRDILVLVTNGGYSDIANVHAKLTLPPEVTLRAPENDTCTVDGSAVDCLWPVAQSGSYSYIRVPVRIADGVPEGTIVPLSSPDVSVTSPYEPANRPSSWAAQVVAAPFSLLVGPPEEPVVLPTADVAIAAETIDGFVAGTTVQLPVTFSNLGEATAVNTVAELELGGVSLTETSIDLPQCSVVDPSHIDCDFGDVGSQVTFTGIITTTLPSDPPAAEAVPAKKTRVATNSAGTLTLSGSITTDTAEADLENNSFLTEYAIDYSAVPVPDPETPTIPQADPAPSAADPSTALATTGITLLPGYLALAAILAATVLLLAARRNKQLERATEHEQ